MNFKSIPIHNKQFKYIRLLLLLLLLLSLLLFNNFVDNQRQFDLLKAPKNDDQNG